MAAAAPTFLYERRTQLRVIAEREHDLRGRNLDEPDVALMAAARDALEQWVRTLELSLLFASFHEAALRLGLRTVADVVRNLERVDALVTTISRLELKEVVEENASVLAPYAKLQPHAQEPAVGDTDVVVRGVRSLLLHCPIDALERAGRDHAMPELAHRCRTAVDALRAFVARHSHPQREAISAVGHAYAEGRLSIDEVAAALELSVPDVVALLDEQGFRRSVDGLRLDNGARRQRLAQIRADRLARRGQPELVVELVAREVIASQRIEDVDARAWLRS